MKKNRLIILIFVCIILSGCEDKSHIMENYEDCYDATTILAHETTDFEIYEMQNPETGELYLKYVNKQTGDFFYCPRYVKRETANAIAYYCHK